MLNLELPKNEYHPPRILCLGAHSDDIEIGCGGTVLKLLQQHPDSRFHWVVFSSDGTRMKEAEQSAGAFLAEAEAKTVVLRNFRDGFFPYIGAEIKDYFEELKREVDPDLIFTHYRRDLHQDHRLVSELTWNTFRNHLILEYEIPKYDGDFGSPNVFVGVDETVVARKIRYILDIFTSQAQNQWFEVEVFRSTLRLRGMESNSPTKYAEAFYGRKMMLA